VKLDVVWTEQKVRDLVGSLVDSGGEICVLCWDQIDYSKRQTRVWLMSSRDGMLYLYGDSHAEAAEKLKKNEVKLYHSIARVSINGSLL
jgi:hypothetical protein